MPSARTTHNARLLSTLLITPLVSAFVARSVSLSNIHGFKVANVRTMPLRMDLEGHYGMVPEEFYDGAARAPGGLSQRTQQPRKAAPRPTTTLRMPVDLFDKAALGAALTQATGMKVVFFGARWCSTCRALQPRLRRLAASRPGVQFYSLTHRPVLADVFAQHNVTEVPSIRVFDASGELVDGTSFSSPLEMRQFEKRLDAHLNERGEIVWGA